MSASTADLFLVVDTVWMMMSGFLVLFMGGGFAMLEAGCMGGRNVNSILAKNVVDKITTVLAWYFLGFGIAYGDDSGAFASFSFFPSSDPTRLANGDIGARHWFFQWGFSFAAATIAGGAMGERVHIPGYAVYAILNCAFVYPTVAHWVWAPGGWLEELGVEDLAGCGVVHMVGGVAALVGAWAVGPRSAKEGPHNTPMVVLGTMILWVGWYGFNAGSVRLTALEDLETVARVAMNNTLGAAGGGLVALLGCSAATGAIDVGVTCNGLLAGLVSVTAGCGCLGSGAALVAGLVGGGVYLGARWLETRLGVDDAVEAAPVHLACGLWGLAAVGIMHPERGLVAGEGRLLAVQMLSAAAIGLWTAAWALAVFLSLRAAGWLRMPENREGNDVAKFGGAAYRIPSSCFLRSQDMHSKSSLA